MARSVKFDPCLINTAERQQMPQVTAAPHPVTLGGKQYMMSPMSDKDMDEINNWLRSTVIDMARRSIPEDATKSEREEMLGVALDRARRLSWMSGEGARLIAEPEGIMRVLHACLRKNHPNLTFQELWDSVVSESADGRKEMDPTELEGAIAVWEELNIPPGQDRRKKTSKAKKKRRKRRRKR